MRLFQNGIIDDKDRESVGRALLLGPANQRFGPRSHLLRVQVRAAEPARDLYSKLTAPPTSRDKPVAEVCPMELSRQSLYGSKVQVITGEVYKLLPRNIRL